MRTVEVVGFQRENLGTKYSKALRAEGNVPCVLYGGGADDQVQHFHAPMYLFRDLVYTHKAAFVKLSIEGEEECEAILQDIQFHPVSEMILHADFLKLERGTLIKMDIPVRTEGISPGVQAGGVLFVKNKKLRVRALPKNMPEEIVLDVSGLDLGKSIQVKDIETEDFKILNNENVSVVVVNIPRTLRSSLETETADDELEEGEEGVAAEGGEGAEGAEGGETQNEGGE